MLERIAALFGSTSHVDKQKSDLPQSAHDVLARRRRLSNLFEHDEDDGSTESTGDHPHHMEDVVTMVQVAKRCAQAAESMKHRLQRVRQRRDSLIAEAKRAEARRRWQLIRKMTRESMRAGKAGNNMLDLSNLATIPRASRALQHHQVKVVLCFFPI